MTRRIGLALTLHNHQPVGNFGWVIEETYVAAYLPMVEALERHPSVRMGLHYTGPLLEGLLKLSRGSGMPHAEWWANCWQLDRLRTG